MKDQQLERTKKILKDMVIDILAEHRGGYQLRILGIAALTIHKMYTKNQ